VDRFVARLFRFVSVRAVAAYDFWHRLFLRVAYPDLSAGMATLIDRRCSIRCFDKGSIAIGLGGGVSEFAQIHAKGGRITIGDNAFIGIGAILVSIDEITIGHDVLIAEYVTIRDQDHEFEAVTPTARAGMRTAPIRIGDNVWIGAKATITSGVTIGDNAVIGANAVVTTDIHANAVFGGVPARFIRMRRVP
jgi:acetyltransferase-like isoleucine patch superfamily enzyme